MIQNFSKINLLFLLQLWKWKTGTSTEQEYRGLPKPSHYPPWEKARARVSRRVSCDEFQKLEPKDRQVSLSIGKHKDTPMKLQLYTFDGDNLGGIWDLEKHR